MSHWERALVSPSASVRQAIEAIEAGVMQMALVVDAEHRLLGTVSDGDVRRSILNGVSLEEQATAVMNAYPTVARPYDDPATIMALMKLKGLKQIPIVDESGRVTGVHTLDELVLLKERRNWVVLMAGGLGRRLSPLTDDCPKPLLKVGGKPLLETILEQFIEQGFKRFFFSINYMADKVREHFGDGSQWGIEIEYLHESQSLGTAGALSLLPDVPAEPVIVMNGDLLTKMNFGQLLDTHRDQRADATMGIREYTFQVPFGVVRVEHNQLVAIEEKPRHRFFVSGGIYALSPSVLAQIQAGKPLQMPGLFESLIEKGYRTQVFPIREYWMDIGQMEDFMRANGEYAEVFQ